MAKSEPKKVPKVSFVSVKKKLRKRTVVITNVYFNSTLSFYMWFKPYGSSKSYGYCSVGNKFNYYSGKKRMMKAFLKEVKDRVKQYDF